MIYAFAYNMLENQSFIQFEYVSPALTQVDLFYAMNGRDDVARCFSVLQPYKILITGEHAGINNLQSAIPWPGHFISMIILKAKILSDFL